MAPRTTHPASSARDSSSANLDSALPASHASQLVDKLMEFATAMLTMIVLSGHPNLEKTKSYLQAEQDNKPKTRRQFTDILLDFRDMLEDLGHTKLMTLREDLRKGSGSKILGTTAIPSKNEIKRMAETAQRLQEICEEIRSMVPGDGEIKRCCLGLEKVLKKCEEMCKLVEKDFNEKWKNSGKIGKLT